METFLNSATESNENECSLSSLGSITPRTKSQWDSVHFSLSSQPNITDKCKQLWLVRHGERMDEISKKSEESRQWRHKIDDKRSFDPPLTKNGFKQASDRGRLLKMELSKVQNEKDIPTCIYSSPMERTLGTAQQIAMHTKLPIIVVPGLSACAAAVQQGGLIKEHVLHRNQLQKCTTVQVITMVRNICEGTKLNVYKALFVSYFEKNGICGEHLITLDSKEFVSDICRKLKDHKIKKYALKLYSALIEYDFTQFQNDEHKQKENDDDDGYELFLKNYGWIGRCHFLTKQQILKQFATNSVEIKFDYRYIESFKQCVDRLTVESKSKIILCVTHREGVRKLDERLKKTRIPYCALAKYGCIESTEKYQLHKSFDYAYFVDDDKREESVDSIDEKNIDEDVLKKLQTLATI